MTAPDENGSFWFPRIPDVNFAIQEKHSQLHVVSQCSMAQSLRWLNTVLAFCEHMSFAKSWHEKGCSSQAETWQVKTILMKDFD